MAAGFIKALTSGFNFHKPHQSVPVLEQFHFRPRRDDFQCVAFRMAEHKTSAGREQPRQAFSIEQLLGE